MEQMAEMVKNLGEETCPVCKDTYLIPCPEHMQHTDADGWCLTCDTPQAAPQPVSCPCQNL